MPSARTALKVKSAAPIAMTTTSAVIEAAHDHGLGAQATHGDVVGDVDAVAAEREVGNVAHQGDEEPRDDRDGADGERVRRVGHQVLALSVGAEPTHRPIRSSRAQKGRRADATSVRAQASRRPARRSVGGRRARQGRRIQRQCQSSSPSPASCRSSFSFVVNATHDSQRAAGRACDRVGYGRGPVATRLGRRAGRVGGMPCGCSRHVGGGEGHVDALGEAERGDVDPRGILARRWCWTRATATAALRVCATPCGGRWESPPVAPNF